MQITKTETRNRGAWLGILVGAVAAGISLLRLWLGDPRSLTEVLWAEDGYFPLCVRNEGAAQCLTEPFAGYFLLIPRLASTVIAPLPLEYWPTASVVIASVLTGLASTAVFLTLRSAGISLWSTTFGSIVLVVSPLYGLEAIGVVASIYVPLLVAASVASVMVTPTRSSGAAVSVLLIVTALTMPSTAVLLLVILVRWRVGNLKPWISGQWASAISLGLIVQAFFALTAPQGRGLSFSRGALRGWVDGVVESVLSAVPGLDWSQADFTALFPLRAPWYGPWLFVGIVVAVALGGLVAPLRQRNGSGGRGFQASLLVLVGVGLSLFPSLAGTFSYRYFVASFSIWIIALLVYLDPYIKQVRKRTIGIATVLIFLLWAPAFAASQVRTSPAPSWLEEIDRASVACQVSQLTRVEVVFTPVWPGNLQGLTIDRPEVACGDLGISK